jgi:hypothetical protein
MLTRTIAFLAIALAGSAGAAGWKDLRIDASSETAFEQSLAEFKDELSTARRHVFGQALKDIWVKGHQEALAGEREYTAADYYRQLDGLTYEQVVRFTDPSGETARERYRAAPRRQYQAPVGRPTNSWEPMAERHYPSVDPSGNPNAKVRVPGEPY